MPKKESLPVGVGRVPAWWMELTPHYTLDLEEDANRRLHEEQEALYYAQMAAADDERIRGEWKSNWGGRSANGGSDGQGGEPLFGGRNFQPGSDGWDPKEWGVEPSDPDYKSYLQGAKLPQSYIDAMKAFGGQHGIKYDASNLKQTSKYGSAGGMPDFTPAWAKKKLRSTGQGAAIRHGIYHDSPNKHLKKRGVNRSAEEDEAPPPSTPQLEQPSTSDEPAAPAAVTPEPVATPAPAPPAPKPVAPPAPPKPVAPPAPPASKWKPPAPTPRPAFVPPPVRSNTPAPPPAEDPVKDEKAAKYSFNDYYYNAGSSPAPTPSPLKHAAPEQAPPKPAAPAPPPPAPKSAVPVPPPPQEETSPEDEGEYEEVVEYVEEYEGEDGEEYEEEIVEEYEEEYEDENPTAASESAGLSDLQALLAQKQAELAKLQGA